MSPPFFAKHMKISNSHQRFAYRLNDQTALEYPERFLGPNWKNVLNFWIYLDTLSGEDFGLIEGSLVGGKNYQNLTNLWNLKCLTKKASQDTIGNEYTTAAWDVPHTIASAYATCELIGSHNLENFTFLPLFLNP